MHAYAKKMYDEEKSSALEDLLCQIAEKMAGKHEEMPFAGKETADEELAEETMEPGKTDMVEQDGDMQERIADFMKNKSLKKPAGISAKLMMISAKPKLKSKMKG